MSNLVRSVIITLVLSVPALSQSGAYRFNLNSSNQNGTAIDMRAFIGPTVNNFSWVKTGTVSAGACALLGSSDGVTYGTTIIAAQTVTSSGGPTSDALADVNYSKISCTTPITGSGSVTFTYNYRVTDSGCANCVTYYNSSGYQSQGEAAFAYNASTNTLTVDNVTVSGTCMGCGGAVTGDANAVSFFDAMGNLDSDTKFTYDGTTIQNTGGAVGGVLPSSTALLKIGTSANGGLVQFGNDVASVDNAKAMSAAVYVESSAGAGNNIVGLDIAAAPLANNFAYVAGAYIESDNQGSGTVTDLIGVDIFIGNFGGGGVTTAYGLRVQDLPSAAVTKLAIKTGTGKIEFDDLKTTGAATGKKVVCVDTTTGILYASSSGTDCSN